MADPVSQLCDLFVQGIILMDKHKNALSAASDVWQGPWAKFKREVDKAAGMAAEPACNIEEKSVVFRRARPAVPAAAVPRCNVPTPAPVEEAEDEDEDEVKFVFDSDESEEADPSPARPLPRAHHRKPVTTARTEVPTVAPSVEVACEAGMAAALQPVGFTASEIDAGDAMFGMLDKDMAATSSKAVKQCMDTQAGLFPQARKLDGRKGGKHGKKKSLVMRSQDEDENDELARQLRAPSPELVQRPPITRSAVEQQPRVQGGKLHHTTEWAAALPLAPPRLSEQSIATTTFPHKYPATPHFFIEGYVCREPGESEQAAMYRHTLAMLRKDIGPVDDDESDL